MLVLNNQINLNGISIIYVKIILKKTALQLIWIVYDRNLEIQIVIGLYLDWN